MKIWYFRFWHFYDFIQTIPFSFHYKHIQPLNEKEIIRQTQQKQTNQPEPHQTQPNRTEPDKQK